MTIANSLFSSMNDLIHNSEDNPKRLEVKSEIRVFYFSVNLRVSLLAEVKKKPTCKNFFKS